MTPNRRKFLISATAALLAAGPAIAQDDAATRSVVRQLEAQGFDIVSVRQTLLGRVRILSRRGSLQREIVLDPRNGVILRDYTVGAGGDPSIGPSPEGGEDDPGGRNGHASGSDDDDDDDDDDGGGDDGGDDGDSGGDDDDD
jgi:hypothetical protein